MVYRRVDELRLDPKNPSLHGARQIRQIARSIEAFGFNCPVLVDAALKVIAGMAECWRLSCSAGTRCPLSASTT